MTNVCTSFVKPWIKTYHFSQTVGLEYHFQINWRTELSIKLLENYVLEWIQMAPKLNINVYEKYDCNESDRIPKSLLKENVLKNCQ